jgi:hypothetical protein
MNNHKIIKTNSNKFNKIIPNIIKNKKLKRKVKINNNNNNLRGKIKTKKYNL